MKKRMQFILLLSLVLCLFTACRGGSQNMTTAPATAATMPTTQSTTMPTTQPETTQDNGNGPLDTQPGDQGTTDTTQTETAQDTETTENQR